MDSERLNYLMFKKRQLQKEVADIWEAMDHISPDDPDYENLSAKGDNIQDKIDAIQRRIKGGKMDGEEKDFYLRERQRLTKQLDDLVSEQDRTSPDDPEYDDLENEIDNIQDDIDEIDGRQTNENIKRS